MAITGDDFRVIIFPEYKNLVINEDYKPAEGRIVPLIPGDFSLAYARLASDSLREYAIVPNGLSMSDSAKIRTSRIARLAAELLHAALDYGSIDSGTAYSRLTIESVAVGCYTLIQGGGRKEAQGLKQREMRLIADATAETAGFLADFCRPPKAVSKQSPKEVESPVNTILDYMARRLLPHDEAAQQELYHLSAFSFDLFLQKMFTPAFVSNIILCLEFPYGATGDGEASAEEELNHIRKEFPREAEKLGDAILDCVDCLLGDGWEREMNGQKGLDKAAAFFKKSGSKVGTLALRAFNKSIGVYVFASINAALRSETSTLLGIFEASLKNRGKGGIANDSELKAKLLSAIPEQLSKVVHYLINEEIRQMESGGETVKKALEIVNLNKMISLIAPVLVDIIWHKDFPLAKLLSQNLPKTLLPFLPPLEYDHVKNSEPSAAARRTIRFAMRFAADYLFPAQQKTDNAIDFYGLFLGFFKVGLKKYLERPNAASSPYGDEEKIRILGMVLAALNRFLCNAIDKNFEFKEEQREVERPLVNLLEVFAKRKYPGNPAVQSQAIKVGLDAANLAVDRLLNPSLLSNLILKLKLNPPSKSPTDTPDAPTLRYDSLGIEFVRLLRTFMRLGNDRGELGWINKLIAGGVRRYHSVIGSQIADGVRTVARSNENSLIDLLEKVLWRSENRDSGPVFFEGWEEDKGHLFKLLEGWVEAELFPFLSKLLAQDGLGQSINSMIENNLRPALRLIISRLFTLLWHEDNKAVRIFIFHHLLPIFQRDLLRLVLDEQQ